METQCNVWGVGSQGRCCAEDMYMMMFGRAFSQTLRDRKSEPLYAGYGYVIRRPSCRL